MLVEAEYERRLHGNNVAGAIFALKNHGWSDKHELRHSGDEGGPLERVGARRIGDAGA